MASLQPPTNFKYKIFWGVLILKNSNLMSSSSSNVVSINPMLMRVPHIEVFEQEKCFKRKKI
jgi:lysyl-tRNA synthetase class I